MNGSGPLRPIDTPAIAHGVADRVAAAREVLGPDRDIAVDFHGRFSLAMARRTLPLLEPYSPLFVEEPVVPEASDLIGQLAAGTCIPIALGERLYNRWGFRRVLGTGIATIQSDLSHAGGISEVREIATMAEAFDVALAPHCPLGPIALAASLQIGCQPQSAHSGTKPRHPLQRRIRSPGLPRRQRRPTHRPRARLGHRCRSRRGSSPHRHRWRNDTWRRDDGAPAEC